MEVVAEVVEALEAMAGLPAVAFSRLHVEQHLVPGVQVHVDAVGVAYQAAGQHLQLLVDEPQIRFFGHGEQKQEEESCILGVGLNIVLHQCKPYILKPAIKSL